MVENIGKGVAAFEREKEDQLLCKTRSLRSLRFSIGEEEEESCESLGISSPQIPSDCKGWSERGDLACVTTAANADFIISYTGLDHEENTLILEHLSRLGASEGPWGKFRRPITFCTQRSLGMGAVHVGAPRSRLFETGRPWFKEFAKAARQTKYGMLIINPSLNYFKSKACVVECRGTGHSSIHGAPLIPKNRHFLYIGEKVLDRVVAWKDWGSVLHVALRQTDLMLLAQKNDSDEMRAVLHRDTHSINCMDNVGMIALMHAAWYGSLDDVAILVEFGANLNSKSWDAKTALDYAIDEKHCDVAAYLRDVALGGGGLLARRWKLDAQGRVFVPWQLQSLDPSTSEDDDSDYQPNRKGCADRRKRRRKSIAKPLH